jgi:hypothetical protein
MEFQGPRAVLSGQIADRRVVRRAPHVFLYLLSEPIGDDFRIFLRRQKAWLQDGDRVVDVAMSSSLADAIARENGRFERHELSGQYFHLASLVGSA